MSKKKNQNKNQPPISDERFIKERMRKLEIGMCYCTEENLRNHGEGVVIVSRKHTGGRVSFCCYLVDTFCIGVKDVHWMLRAETIELEEIVNHYDDIDLCDYVTAHNWIYGALAFAEDAGIQPCKEFRTAQYFLQEDDDDVPLIEFPFGLHGKHHLVANDRAELNRYLPTLRKNLGEEFTYSVNNSMEDLTVDDDEEEDGHENFFEIEKRMAKRDSVYSYHHPDYPKELKLFHQEVYDLLNQANENYTISGTVAKRLLSLPKEELRSDLEQTIYYILGRLYDDTANDEEYIAIGDAIMLLGEVGNPDNSLDAVLEAMRVPFELYDLIISDWGETILAPTIYKLGHKRLDRLKAFMLEEGLDHISKSYVSRAVCEMAIRDKKCRDEVLNWYHDLLNLVVDGQKHDNQIDPSLVGLMIGDLMNMGAKELLPEIEKAFQCNMVNYVISGKYQEVYHEIITGQHAFVKFETDLFNRLEHIKNFNNNNP